MVISVGAATVSIDDPREVSTDMDVAVNWIWRVLNFLHAAICRGVHGRCGGAVAFTSH